MQEGAVLEMRGICKYFPGVRALQDVDFTLRKGEIHALMGENGAGKSTLIKVLTGVYPKDGGEVHIEGVDGPAVIRSPQDAQNVGISTVYQEITLCPNLSVAENMYIGRTKGAVTNWRKMNSGAGKILESLGIPASPQQQLGSCSIAVQQMVAIARAVDMECKVLILDEPTSSLDEQEVQKLFGLMRDLRKKGVGIIFVTHFLEQVYEVCDRITVLRDGQLVGEYVIEDLPRVKLVSKMLGKELDDMKLGIGYLPEDRKGDGIVGDLSVRENIILAYQVMKGFFRPISRAQAEAFADNYIKLLEIKTASADTPIKSLSGGNQQKCILARWLLTDPKYLILDEPTRGIDIGTKIEIQKLVLRLAEKGTSATFISSEIDEMLRTCSRLIVMRDRKAVGELSGGDLTQTRILVEQGYQRYNMGVRFGSS